MTLYRSLNYDRETKEDRFARYIGENNFKVLIEAWRTPDPRPASIKVELSSDPIDAELLDREMIEKRLFMFAQESNQQQAGILDNTKYHMQRMPEDLKAIRKIPIGRHRIYYKGHHTQCSYEAFYIKKFKQFGKDDEDNSRFQNKLISAVGRPPIQPIEIENN